MCGKVGPLLRVCSRYGEGCSHPWRTRPNIGEIFLGGERGGGRKKSDLKSHRVGVPRRAYLACRARGGGGKGLSDEGTGCCGLAIKTYQRSLEGLGEASAIACLACWMGGLRQVRPNLVATKLHLQF